MFIIVFYVHDYNAVWSRSFLSPCIYHINGHENIRWYTRKSLVFNINPYFSKALKIMYFTRPDERACGRGRHINIMLHHINRCVSLTRRQIDVIYLLNECVEQAKERICVFSSLSLSASRSLPLFSNFVCICVSVTKNCDKHQRKYGQKKTKTWNVYPEMPSKTASFLSCAFARVTNEIKGKWENMKSSGKRERVQEDEEKKNNRE